MTDGLPRLGAGIEAPPATDPGAERPMADGGIFAYVMDMFGKRQARAVSCAPARTPEATRVYAVGDIHGRADLVGRMHKMIRDDAATAAGVRKVVVYLGDYVDRGLFSREVIDLLLDRPLAGFEAVHLKGNHEELMLAFLDDIQVGPTWLMNGGNATLRSYGVDTTVFDYDDAKGLEALQAEIGAALPKRHLDFLNSLDLSHVEGDYLFVHAGVRPGVALDRQRAEDLMWIRAEFTESAADHGKVVVHGHTISWEPEPRDNRIGIDTGAFASGVLTCLVLEGEERQFLTTADGAGGKR